MQSTASNARTGRRALDRRLQSWRALGSDGNTPHGGWIRAIREAIGMTPADLAARMGVERTTFVRLEQSERAGRIQLGTLTRAADALQCDLVYALVPRHPLETTVVRRAEKLARADLAGVDHTMLLEDQQVPDGNDPEQVAEYAARLLEQPGLWHDMS